ncbi:MAG TPA: AMIN domain-containing protein [Methylomirabilota bacterium]|nr:AMIN domain-containing protein [Methylomirabilota bacterium]
MLCAVLGVLVQAPPAAAETVISQIRVSPRDGQTEIEVLASEPLNYVILERADPAGITLFFLNATFAFPSNDAAGVQGALRRMATRLIEKDGSRLAQLDLVFNRHAEYKVALDGRRLRVTVELPSREGETVWGSTPGARPPLATSPATPPSKPPPAPPPMPEPPAKSEPPALKPRGVKLLAVRAASSAGATTVSIDSSGPVTYETLTLEQPARIVIDFQEARLELERSPQAPAGSIIQDVRVAEFRKGTIRVVIELRRATPYWVERKSRGIVVHLGETSPRAR